MKRPSLPLVAVAATAASKSARTRQSGTEMCSMNYQPTRDGGSLQARGVAVDGGRTRQLSPVSVMSTTPQPHTAQPNRNRDVRAAVCAIVARLTIKLLDPGAGVESKDKYVANARGDIRKGKSAAVQQIAAIAYDDIVHKGRSAAEAKAWLLELCEEIDALEAERDGQRIAPPDIMPVLRVENREECGENDAALQLAANLTSIEAHERYVKEAQEEIDAQVDAIDLARQRLVLLRRNA